ncbi:MAG: SLC13 family permease [Gammaproteobacteria bacterium]|nr:SLC13 family permease [Gammaproteobacteria bacterium]
MELTTEMLWVLGLLAFTVYLFVSEVVRVDVAAILVLVLLGLTTVLPFVPPLVETEQLFDGFASNAVISIIAVMIIGAGLDRTGIMGLVANHILRVGGSTERRIIPLISGTTAVISSFMQNVGAAALFLPVVSRISVRTGLPLSRLLMPMGFCAILGGTMTMIGSSPLILLNDLIGTSNQVLAGKGLEPMAEFSLFAVTPIGLALVATGIGYFMLLGHRVLPVAESRAVTTMASTLEYLQRVYGLGYTLNEARVPALSPLVGRTVGDIEHEFHLRVVAVQTGQELSLAPGGLARDTRIEASQVLGILASSSRLGPFAAAARLRINTDLDVLASALKPDRAGIAELVIPPSSALIGKSGRDLWMRKTYGLTVLAIHRQGKAISEEDEGLDDIPFQGGDTLICHVAWNQLARLERDRDFVIVTTEYPHEELRPHKVPHALVFFAIALGLVLFTDLRLSVALLTGAVGMVLSGVLTMDEAYQAVSWKTVFLLASLIPLGAAVEGSGTAAWIAVHTLELLGSDVSPLLLQLVVAVLATLFSLVMSNVGATVLLVPLAVNIAVQAKLAGVVGADPAVFALIVALATSNSFLIPTHQVNALIMGPGGYRVKDFLRAGGIMTLLFLVVMLGMLQLLY